MKIYVINLRRSADRRSSIRAQLDPLGVDYQFFNAISGDRGYEHFEAYDDQQFLLNMGREARVGEIGSYASHRSLWKRCVSDGEPIVIMEDDAEIQTNFLDALGEVERLIPVYGFIRMESDGPNRNARPVPVERAGHFTLYYYQRCPYGALCYAMSPGAAASFVDKSRVLTGSVDWFIRRAWEHGQPLFAMSPYSVQGSALRELPTISERGKGSYGIGLRARRQLNKLKGRIGRARFNAEYRNRIKRSAKMGALEPSDQRSDQESAL